MDTSRRRVLQLLGLSAAALSAPPVFNALARDEHAAAEPTIAPGKDALKAKQWAMVIKTREFKTRDDVRPLVEACHKVHNVPTIDFKRWEIKWIWPTRYENAFAGSTSNRFLSEEIEHRPFIVLCNHCENPPCV